MKSKQPNLFKFLTICFGPALAGASLTAVHAADATWNGAAATNVLNTTGNWTGNVAPNAAGDTATWNGSVGGNLALTWTGGFGSAPNGTNVALTTAQTSNLVIGSGSVGATGTEDLFALGNITVQSGAGALTLGDGVGIDSFVFRNPGGVTTNSLTNNSANTVTFAANTRLNSGGGAARAIMIDGSGNWQFDFPLQLAGQGVLNFTKDGEGTLTLTGTGGANTFVVNSGTLKVAGAGLLGTPTYAPAFVVEGAFSYESSATQTMTGAISGGGTINQSTGNLIITGNNTAYFGEVTITGGTLNVSGTGTLNSANGIVVNGPAAKYLHTSTETSFQFIDLTQGTVGGTGTIATVIVANGTGMIANGNGNATLLTIEQLEFNGAGALNLTDDGNPATPALSVPSFLDTDPSLGKVTVNASNTFWNSGITYNLVDAPSFGGSLSDFTLGTISGLTNRQSASLVLNGNMIGVEIGGDSPRWSGLDNSNWVVGSTGPNSNWKLINGETPTDYINGDVVFFDDSATNTTVSIPGANVNPAVVNFDNTGDYILNGAFGIASGSLNKNGTGNVTISTPNTYGGGTTINAGTLTLSGAGTLGAPGGALTAAGGTVNLGGSSQTFGSLAITGAAVLQNGTLTASSLNASNPSGNAVVSSSLDLVSGSLAKSGEGTLTLSGPTTYAGTTTISGGVLALGGTGSLGATSGVTLSGGSLNLGGKSQTTGGINISAAYPAGDTISNGTITPSSFSIDSAAGVAAVVSANITGATGVTRNGNDGTLTLTGNNTFTGPLNFGGNGTVIIGGGSNTGGGPITYNSFGSNFTVNAGSYLTSGITSSGYSEFRNLNFNGGFLESAGNIFTDALAISINFNGGTLKSGNPAGITVFDANNQIAVNAGGATIDTTTGNVTVGLNTGGAAALANPLARLNGTAGAPITLLGGKSLVSGIANNGVLNIQGSSIWDLNGIASSVAGLSGTGSVTNALGAAVLTLNPTSPATYSGSIAGGTAISLVKQGAATQTLSGNNTYQGDTTVLGGVLAVTGNALPNTGKLVIDGGVVNLTGTEVVGSLFFGGDEQATGTWGSSSSVPTPTNIDDTRFSGTGVLSVVPPPAGGYTAWASARGLTAGVNDGPNQDPDFDGISNLLEYVLGGLPIGAGSANTSILPVQSLDANNITLTFKRSDLSEADTTQVVQISNGLATWSNFATVGPASAGPVTVTEDAPTAELDTVSVVIPRSGNAPDGKLFVRVQAVKLP